MADCDAVLTALGPHYTGPTTIGQDSVCSIIQAMQKPGTRRASPSGSIVTDEAQAPTCATCSSWWYGVHFSA